MILVTVGMQLGFDRLIEAMDVVARDLEENVIAQIGKGRYQPQHMACHEAIVPSEFEALVRKARVVVAHAGIGTVLTAQDFETPVILVPRSAELGEHRNDHQRATARQLSGRPNITVVDVQEGLSQALAQALMGKLVGQPDAANDAEQLKDAIRNFIRNGAFD